MAEPDHSSRDRHLFGPGPKRILALDGGGVRGVIAVAFLERIEAVLAAREGRDVRLADYFDLIGGTSTGAIIGCALAFGKTTDELQGLLFSSRPPRVPQTVLAYHRLASEIRRPRLAAGDRRGGRRPDARHADLRTGYALVAKRMDTGSVWIVANNPRAPYWESPPEKNFIGNRHYPLANLVRASTAAPTYFEPESIRITGGDTGPVRRRRSIAAQQSGACAVHDVAPCALRAQLGDRRRQADCRVDRHGWLPRRGGQRSPS